MCVCAYTSHVTKKKKKKEEWMLRAKWGVGVGGGWQAGWCTVKATVRQVQGRKKKRSIPQFGDPLLSFFFFFSLSWPSPLCVGPDGLLCVEMTRACSPPLPPPAPPPNQASALASWEHMTAEHKQLAFLTEPNSPAFPCLPAPAKTAPFYPFHCLLQTIYNKQRGRQNIY